MAPAKDVGYEKLTGRLIAMQLHGYTDFKDLIVSVTHLSKDAIHIYIGFICLLASVVILRRSLTSYRVLVPGGIISCAIEVLDWVDGYWFFSGILWRSSLHDLVNTNLIPVLLVTLARWQWEKLATSILPGREVETEARADMDCT